MPKIQVRLNLQQLISYAGKDQPIDFILKSGQVFRARLLEITENQVRTKNALGHKKTLQVMEIQEMWTDANQEIQ